MDSLEVDDVVVFVVSLLTTRGKVCCCTIWVAFFCLPWSRGTPRQFSQPLRRSAGLHCFSDFIFVFLILFLAAVLRIHM